MNRAHQSCETSKPVSPEELGPRERWLYVVMASLLIFMSASIIWRFEFLPLQDYPYHLVRFHISANFWNHNYNFAELASLSLFPTPYILTDYVATLLSKVVSIETAGKIVISVYVIFLPISIFYVVHAWNPRNLVVGFFGFLLLFNWCFAMGFTSFVLSIPFSLFALGYWWKNRSASTWRTRAVLAVLLFLTYMSHLFGFCFVIFAMAVLWVQSCIKRQASPYDALAVVPSLLALAFVLVRDVGGSGGIEDSVGLFGGIEGAVGLMYKNFWDKLDFAVDRTIPFLTSYNVRKEILVLYGALWLALGLLVRQAFRKEAFSAGAMTAVASMALVYFLLPEHFVLPKIAYISHRALIFMILMALLLLNAPKSVVPRIALSLGLFGLSCGFLAITYASYSASNVQLSRISDALDTIPENSRLSTWVENRAVKMGRIKPGVFHDGYYYINRAGNRIPSIPSFGGPLRGLKFKDQSKREKPAAEVLAAACRNLGESQYLLTIPYRPSISAYLERESAGCYLKRVAIGIGIYGVRRGIQQGAETDGATKGDTPKGIFRRGFEDTYEYVLIVAKEDWSERFERDHELVFTREDVHVWRRLRISGEPS